MKYRVENICAGGEEGFRDVESPEEAVKVMREIWEKNNPNNPDIRLGNLTAYLCLLGSEDGILYDCRCCDLPKE